MKLKIALMFCVLMLAADCTLAAQNPRKVSFNDLDGVSSGEEFVLTTLDISPNGRQLAVERGRVLRIVDAATGHVLHELGKGLLPRWSPRGNKLAFYSLRSGKLQLWLWNAADGKLRQVTDFPGGIDPDLYTRITGYISDAFRFDWSPDGMRIALASRVVSPSASPQETGQPLILDNGTPPDLTLRGVFAQPSLGTGGIPEAKDGRSVSFRTTDPSKMLANRLFVIDVETGAIEQIGHGADENFHPSWSPDGGSIAFARVQSDDGKAINLVSAKSSQIIVFDLATKRERTLVSGSGFKYRPHWSRQGNEIAYLFGSDIFAQPSIHVIDVQNARPEKNYDTKVRISDYDWSRGRDGGFLLSYTVGNGVTKLGELHLDGKIIPIFSGSTTMSIGPWAQADNGMVAWVEGISGPGLRLIRPGQAKPKRITLPVPKDKLEFGTIEVVTYRTARGDILHGKLLYPPDYQVGKRYPLIVDAYPLWSGNMWMHPMSGNQAWAAAGYMVFKPNQARAPHVWVNCAGNRAFCSASRGPGAWDVMVDDVMSGVDALIQRGLVDPQRMCLYGHSNGGGVVDYLVTRTNRFKCAVAVSPVWPNWVGAPLLNTGTWDLMKKWTGVDPLENPDAYIKLSAVFHVDKVHTPIMLAVGDKDGSFLLGSIEMYNALRFAGKQVTFLRYPNEGHVFVGPGLRDLWDREMAFFARYLHPSK